MVLACVLQYSQLKKRSRKKLKPQTGFKPAPSRYLLLYTFATWKEMTRTHSNQSLGTLIFLIIHDNIWQFVAFPYILVVRKAAKHQNKNLSSKSALLIPTVSTSAFHSTNLFLFSCHHIPTNSIAPLSAYKPTHNPQFLQSL